MKDENKSSLKNFFKANLGSTLNSESDDRSHRSFLRKRDSHNSSTSSLDNLSSAGSKSSRASHDERKSSHLSLKRFLKKFMHDEHKEKKKHHLHILPQHQTSDLYKKYTQGKYLGSGASGSVNIVHLRTDPSKIYAVKKFRNKLPNESESDYKIKVDNEFKIGDILDHENLIKTYELIKDQTGVFSHPEFYIIMDYCPYDFFNLVMSGLMDQNEINCYFKQIIEGVRHLHYMGLAHRDLKLDNCVVTDKGILKLIDFGSAVQFRKQMVEGTVESQVLTHEGKQYRLALSKGIVGSDPYLSPEVFEVEESRSEYVGYDARKVDVWSIAIIFCCMVLKRFPWKLPKISDSSYKQFLANNDKLFKLLPKESVGIISKMLKPKEERCLIDDVTQHPFVEQIEQCLSISPAKNHIHNLVTEEQLEQINKEKEVLKKLQKTGVA